MSSNSLQKRDLLDVISLAVQQQGKLTVLFANAVANQIGLSAIEFECWDIVRTNKSITAGKLGELCGLTSGAITGVVDRLERAGFVKRVPDSKDRRRVYIVSAATAKQLRKINELYQEISDRFDEITASYTEAELAFLIDFYGRTNSMSSDLIARLNNKPIASPNI